MDKRNWISSRKAREILGVNSSRIRQLCIWGYLRAEKEGRDWWINVDSLYEHADKQVKNINKATRVKNFLLNNFIQYESRCEDEKLKEQVEELKDIRKNNPETKLKDVEMLLENIENQLIRENK